jgi:uncharacterized protein YbbC (DUF1343 family)
MVSVGDALDSDTGLPVVSLYGKDQGSLRPIPSTLEDLDVLVCDLQDVGSRYYTYVWTALLCLEACSALGVEVLLCDRPNPLGGVEIEGGRILPGFESFVGLHDVPTRHGLTIGELVGLAAAERGAGECLRIVRMTGWNREMDFEATGRPWVMPSPNMPTLDTAFVYPGMCLVEATSMSEGRGTTRPFELFGAPGIPPAALARHMEALSLPGVRFRATWFRPAFQKHAGNDCGGVQLHVTDRRIFKPLRTALSLLEAVRRIAPEAMSWREAPYEFVSDVPAIDLLAGSTALREALASGGGVEDVLALWDSEAAAFDERRAPHLLY